MLKWLHNKTGSEKTYLGRPIPAGEFFEIPLNLQNSFSEIDSLLTDIANGDIAVSKDGSTDITGVSSQIDYLKNQTPSKISFDKVTSDGIGKVATYEPEGNFATKISHDLTDKTTWYNMSVRVVDETLSLESGNTYSFAHQFIIDLCNGKVTDEDAISAEYLTVIKVANVVQENGFTIDYEAGTVTFDSAPSETPTASYSYATTSEFVVKPASNSSLKVKHCEVQFTSDVQMRPIAFEVWGYNPYDLPNKVCYERKVYKNEKDVVNIANLGQGFIPKFGALQHDVLVFPFNYGRAINLKDSQGLEMRIKIIDDIPFTGEFSTVALYTIEDTE